MILLRRTLIIIFAIIFCLLIWYIGPEVAVGKFHPFASVWIRVLMISVILFIVFWPIAVVFLSFTLRYFLKPFKQKPKQKKELDVVTSRFYDTISTLKRSGIDSKKNKWQTFLYLFKKPYLNDRPWYLVIGQKEVGKTSIIFNSGEQFLYSQHYGFGKTVSTGSTKEYNAWISNRAVYFDTSEEWLKLDGQQEESANHVKKFFQLVKKFRPDSGLDGIVLCLDAYWLQHSSINGLKSFSDSLRVRILEITKDLSEDLPVYLFINKLDLLPGAKDFMYIFNDDILKKGIGLSAPPIKINGREENYFEIFSARYDDWLKKQTDYLLYVLHDTVNGDTREQLFNFIEAIGSLKTPILNIVEQIFPSYPTGYSGYLHDIWFGSIISLKFNEEDLDKKALGELYYPAFTRIIQSQGVLNILTSAKKKWLSRKNLVLYAILGIVSVFTIFVLSSRYLWEVDYISFVSQKFKDTKRIIKEVPINSNNKVGNELLYAYAQLDYMTSQTRYKFDQYKINPYLEHIFVYDALSQTYHKHLLKFFWPAVTNYVTNRLAEHIRDNNIREIYGTLRIYQMFLKPEHRSSEELVVWFIKNWNNFAPQGYTEDDKKIFSYHIVRLFEDKFSDGIPMITPNSSLLRVAISKASQALMTDKVLSRIKDIPIPEGIVPISLVTASGNTASLMLKHKDGKSVIDSSVSAFYTRAAYRDIFLENLDKVTDSVIDELSWVLEDNSQKNASKADLLVFRQKLKDDMIKIYLMDFVNEWKNFLNNITIRKIKNLEDTALLARQLAETSSPVVNLFRFLNRELNLTGSSDENSGNALQRTFAGVDKKKRQVIGEISGKRDQFRLTPEKIVEDQFKDVILIGNSINNINGDLSSNPVSKLFDDIYNLIYPLSLIIKNDPSASNQQETVFNQIKMKAFSQPEPLKSILLDLIEFSQTTAIKSIENSLNTKLEGMFSEVCRTTIKSKYPFNRGAKEEVSTMDFNRMFGPSGSLDEFFKKSNIGGSAGLASEGSEQMNTNPLAVNQKMMNAYNNATQVRNAFFPNGSNGINLSFDLKPISLSSNVFKVELFIGGQEIKYSHGFPTVTRVTWPPQGSNNLIRIVFQTEDGSVKIKTFEGPWALFKLYDSSKVVNTGSNYRVISFTIENKYSFEMEIKSEMNNFPLWNNSVRNFSCP